MHSFAGGDNEGPWFMPDILVNVRKAADESSVGVIREVLPVCSYGPSIFLFLYKKKFALYIFV